MIYKKDSLIEALETCFNETQQLILDLDENQLNIQKNDKWSVAEQSQHLILSIKPLILAFKLPKILLRFFGKPNRPSRDYFQIQERYENKLKHGAKATKAYIPSTKLIKKDKLLVDFEKYTSNFLKMLNEKWDEKQLDSYFLPHPIIGKLTFREMLFFTHYHNKFHNLSMQEVSKKVKFATANEKKNS